MEEALESSRKNRLAMYYSDFNLPLPIQAEVLHITMKSLKIFV